VTEASGWGEWLGIIRIPPKSQKNSLETPSGYPSIYQGCHWGNCSSGGLSSDPVEVSDLTPGAVTSSWSTTQPGGSANAYDVAYDIWFGYTQSDWYLIDVEAGFELWQGGAGLETNSFSVDVNG
jgi:hypothetical protein